MIYLDRFLFNFFDNLNFSKDLEIEEVIYEDDDIIINRTLSLNQDTEEFDQDDLEIVMLYDGKASIEFKDEILHLKPGDIIKINPHDVHRVFDQDKAIWLCVFKKVGKNGQEQ